VGLDQTKSLSRARTHTNREGAMDCNGCPQKSHIRGRFISVDEGSKQPQQGERSLVEWNFPDDISEGGPAMNSLLIRNQNPDNCLEKAYSDASYLINAASRIIPEYEGFDEDTGKANEVQITMSQIPLISTRLEFIKDNLMKILDNKNRFIYEDDRNYEVGELVLKDAVDAFANLLDTIEKDIVYAIHSHEEDLEVARQKSGSPAPITGNINDLLRDIEKLLDGISKGFGIYGHEDRVNLAFEEFKTSSSVKALGDSEVLEKLSESINTLSEYSKEYSRIIELNTNLSINNETLKDKNVLQSSKDQERFEGDFIKRLSKSTKFEVKAQTPVSKEKAKIPRSLLKGIATENLDSIIRKLVNNDNNYDTYETVSMTLLYPKLSEPSPPPESKVVKVEGVSSKNKPAFVPIYRFSTDGKNTSWVNIGSAKIPLSTFGGGAVVSLDKDGLVAPSVVLISSTPLVFKRTASSVKTTKDESSLVKGKGVIKDEEEGGEEEDAPATTLGTRTGPTTDPDLDSVSNFRKDINSILGDKILKESTEKVTELTVDILSIVSPDVVSSSSSSPAQKEEDPKAEVLKAITSTIRREGEEKVILKNENEALTPLYQSLEKEGKRLINPKPKDVAMALIVSKDIRKGVATTGDEEAVTKESHILETLFKVSLDDFHAGEQSTLGRESAKDILDDEQKRPSIIAIDGTLEIKGSDKKANEVDGVGFEFRNTFPVYSSGKNNAKKTIGITFIFDQGKNIQGSLDDKTENIISKVDNRRVPNTLVDIRSFYVIPVDDDDDDDDDGSGSSAEEELDPNTALTIKYLPSHNTEFVDTRPTAISWANKRGMAMFEEDITYYKGTLYLKVYCINEPIRNALDDAMILDLGFYSGQSNFEGKSQFYNSEGFAREISIYYIKYDIYPTKFSGEETTYTARFEQVIKHVPHSERVSPILMYAFIPSVGSVLRANKIEGKTKPITGRINGKSESKDKRLIVESEGDDTSEDDTGLYNPHVTEEEDASLYVDDDDDYTSEAESEGDKNPQDTGVGGDNWSNIRAELWDLW